MFRVTSEIDSTAYVAVSRLQPNIHVPSKASLAGCKPAKEEATVQSTF
jgi:hypothetical protein